MNRTSFLRWVGASATSILVLAGLGLALNAASEPKEKQVNGHLDSQVVTEGCESPVGLCTRGRMTGTIQGDVEFSVSQLLAAPEQASPTVTFYVGQIVIHATDGDLVGTDAAAIDFATGAFADLVTIDPAKSTGRWAGATGQLRFSGDCDLSQGVCMSDYQGTVVIVSP